MTTEEKLADLRELAEHVQTRGEYEYIQEQIEELEDMLKDEEQIRLNERDEQYISEDMHWTEENDG